MENENTNANNTANKSVQTIPKKITVEGKTIKLHKIYRKKYTVNSVKKKLLKKIFITEDKKFVASFFIPTSSDKNTPVIFQHQKITSKKDIKRLNLIAKEVAHQKGRINFLHILIALGLVCALMVGAYFLRNVLAKKILISSSQKMFGAKCEIETVDFNIFDTHLYIKDYRVANKNAPMYNLFEIGLADIHFNLLELSRRKLVCKNIAIEDITWNTKRKTSGALPAPQPRTTKQNPVVALIKSEVDKVTSKVSAARGFSAVKNQLDPRVIFEREKAAFTTPKIAAEIMETVPQLREKWEDRVQATKKQAEKTIAVGKSLASIDVDEINSLQELEKDLRKIKKAIDTIDENTEMTKNLINTINKDAYTVKKMVKSANTAIRHDANHIKEITNKIRSFNLDSGSRFISSLFDSFVINSLGTLYPYVSMGLTKMQDMQASAQDKPETLKDKVKKLERLKGKNFIFEKHPLPSIVFHSISLSGHDPNKILHLGGSIKDVSNNADQLGVPILLNINAAHSKLKETFDGIVDLRTYSEEWLDGLVSVDGITVDIPAAAQGVPSLQGNTDVSLNVNMKKNHAIYINGTMSVNDPVLHLNEFKPKLVHTIYSQILSGIHHINLEVDIHVLDRKTFNMHITSDVDDQIADKLEKELNAQITKIKKDVEKQCRLFLSATKKEYTDTVQEFTSLVADIKNNEKTLAHVELLLNEKEKEIEKKIANYGKEKVTNALRDLF